MIGRTVSHYRVLARLGEGGMGVVYKAEDLRLPRIVALKFLPADIAADDPARARFLNEARAAASLDHSNICRVWDIDEVDGRPFIVMSFVDGATLRDRLAGGPLPVEAALRVAIEVADGLADAHARGVVHRDIKPSNILIGSDDRARVTDFGLALLADATRITGEGLAVGTPLYMAPEQIGGADVDRRADIWALGAVLHEMLTGRPPFVAEYREALFYAILHTDPPPVSALRPDAPPELDLIVAKALARDPAARYADATGMLRDLRQARARLVGEGGGGLPDWILRRLRRRLAAVVAAAVVLTAAVATLLLRGGGADPGPVPRARPIQVTSSPAWETDPALSPDGSRIAFVCDEGGQRDVLVVAVGGGQPLRVTDDPADDYDPAWFPDGGSIAFVSERSGRPAIWRTGQMGGGATLLVDDALRPAVSPDGREIAFCRADSAGEIRVFAAPLADPGAARQLTRAGEGLWIHDAPAWSPDGRTLCYATQHDLWLVDPRGERARRLLDGGISDANPCWSPDAAWIYFDSYRGDNRALWRAPARGGPPQRLSLGSGHEHHPSVSADGARLAYATEFADRDIAILDRRTRREVRIYDSQRSGMPALAPDGGAVAYVSDREAGHQALWVQPLADGAPAGPPRRLNDQAGRASHPVWSPDGAWIAYYLIDEATSGRDVWTIPAAGGQPSRLTDGVGVNGQPAWSPDGRALAFVSQRNGRDELWVVTIAGGRPAGPLRPLETGLAMATAPCWSPDGTRIAVVGEGDPGGDIWLVPARGGTARRLTHGAGMRRVRWDAGGDALLAMGMWGGGRPALRRVSADDGRLLDGEPPVAFASSQSGIFFDASRDGRYLAFTREESTGDIWLLQAESRAF